MNIKSTKEMLALGLMAAFLFFSSSCSEKRSEATDTVTESLEEEKEEKVNVPDYSSVSAELKGQIAQVYQDYIALKNALVETKGDAAQSAAAVLKSSLEKVDAAKIEGEAKKFVESKVALAKQHAGQIANFKDIEEQRGQMDVLSSNLFELIKATGSSPGTLYYQHCPMALEDKGGYWISENKEIRNPYFGEKMMECGENKETLSKKM